MKAIKALILSLALLWPTGGGNGVTAHELKFVPTPDYRIEVNSCGGGIVGYNTRRGEVLGVTATHCVAAPTSKIWVGPDNEPGRKLRTIGDVTFFVYDAPKRPKRVLKVARDMPKPGEYVWLVTQSYEDTFTPVPAVWLGILDGYPTKKNPEFMYWLVYGASVKGFSGSPVVNMDGELVGIVSIGQFVDINDVEQTELAPWTGVSLVTRGSNR